MKTFYEFLQTEATIMPTFGALQNQKNINDKKNAANTWSKAKTMPTYSAMKAAQGMKEDEMEEGIFDFFKKKPESTKGRLYRPDDGPIMTNKAHDASKILKRQAPDVGPDPAKMKTFKPSWQTDGKRDDGL